MKARQQLIPLLLTVFTFFVLSALLYVLLFLLKFFPLNSKIILTIFPLDVLIGLTIYLKTAIDFALFIGNLMAKHPGWKNRIAIETGTAVGNGLGTFLILIIWTFFKEIPLLLFFMIILASLVLLQMGQEGLEDYLLSPSLPGIISRFIQYLFFLIKKINTFFSPLTRRMLPSISLKEKRMATFQKLFVFSLTVPFVLGLDDFAGYIPLFSIINIFGFAIGVFLGHMVLNLALFAYPAGTIKIVRLPLVLVVGSLIFIGLALFGCLEAFRVLSHMLPL